MRRSTWIVLVLFGLLVGFTILFQRYQANKVDNAATATPTSPPVYLYNLGNTQINDIKIADTSGKSIEVYRDPTSTKWAITGVPVDQADASQIETMSTQLLKLQVQETLTQTLPLASIGLESPAYTITLKTSNGNQVMTYVGIQTAIGSGYYVRNDAGQLMIVGKTEMDNILNLLNKPPLLPTATPAATPVETISPTVPKGQVTPTP